MAGHEGGQALDIEPGDEMGDGVAGAAAGGAGGLLVVITASDGQEHGGPRDLGGGRGLRPAELGRGGALVVGERPEWILLAAGHDDLHVSGGRPSYRRDEVYGYRRDK
jgi:hypothetical protein